MGTDADGLALQLSTLLSPSHHHNKQPSYILIQRNTKVLTGFTRAKHYVKHCMCIVLFSLILITIFGVGGSLPVLKRRKCAES